MTAKVLVPLLIAWASAALAQESGGLEGRVTDASGEAIPGANVVVEGAALTEKRGTTTDEKGRFRVDDLPAGAYQVTVSHIGYATQVARGILVRAGGMVELALKLASEIIFLDQNVVSASRRQEKLLEAPASVAVVEGREIRQRPALSVSEHVRDLPAVDFAQTGLVQSNVVVRGFNNIFSGALLTLTDNRIARVPSLRLNAYNFIPVSSEDIERIEVVLGPGSALYGPNSANGVMHIITQSPFTSAGTHVNLGVGERSLRRLSMRHAGKAGEALGYKISAQYYAGTDWKYRDPEEEAARRTALAGGADPGALRIGARDFDVERQAAELRLDWKPTQGTTAIFSTGYNKGDHIELTGLGAGQAEDWTYNYAQVRLLYGDWFAQVFRNWSDAGKTFLLRDGSAIVDKSSLTVFQVQHAAGLGARQRFTYGLDVLLTRPDTEGTITGNNEEDDDIDEFGLYAQSDTRLSEKLDLVLALRYDEHNRLEEAELSPRAGLVFKPGQAQTVRLTYNRAFSTPTTNNLYLDLVSRRDVFGVRASFAPIFQAQGLEFQPIDLRVQGTYRKGFDEGFTFRRGTDHRPLYRSPFAPLVAGQLSRMGLSPGSAGYSIGQDGYLALDDPVATGVMWGVGRAAVLNALTPLFEQLVAAQLQTQGQDQATAQATARQLGAGLPGVVPEQLAGLRNSLREFNIEKALAGDRAPFDPVADAFDVPRTRSTITETFELGYKAVLGRKLVVAADLYRTKTEDFGGPLGVETPNVFLDAQSVAATLGPNIAAALADPANAALAQALANLDNLRLPGLIEGNKNGSPVDELTTLFAGGAGRIPFGTVSPEQAYDPTALILTYRNFGEVSLNGLDLSLAYYATDRWTLTGNYSWVSDSFFRNVDGIADVALNAPQNKLKVGSAYAFPQWDLQVGGQVRYSGAFRQDSGVYVGKVPAHAVLDLNLVYRLPFDYGLTLALDVGNALDNRHREFVGAPKVGRLVLAQVGAAF